MQCWRTAYSKSSDHNRQGSKSKVVCVMVQCENQMKRTSVAMGQAHPVWKEEVTFKSVQITSDLQVSFCSLTAHSIVLTRLCPGANNVLLFFSYLVLSLFCEGQTQAHGSHDHLLDHPLRTRLT